MQNEEAGEGEESPEVEAQEDKPSIEGLLKLDDAGLMEVLGFNRKLEQVKQDLQDLAKLTGKAREFAEREIERKLTPEISESSFRYLVEDAQRMAKSSDGKAALGDTSPASVL